MAKPGANDMTHKPIILRSAEDVLLAAPFEDRKSLFASGNAGVPVTGRAVFLAGGTWFPLDPHRIVAVFGDGRTGHRFVGTIGGFGWTPATQAQVRAARDGTRWFRTCDEAQPLRGEIGWRGR
jgi:hypothetical protein